MKLGFETLSKGVSVIHARKEESAPTSGKRDPAVYVQPASSSFDAEMFGNKLLLQGRTLRNFLIVLSSNGR